MTNFLKSFWNDEAGQDIVESQLTFSPYRCCRLICLNDNGQKHH